eukprot:g25521.t1
MAVKEAPERTQKGQRWLSRSELAELIQTLRKAVPQYYPAARKAEDAQCVVLGRDVFHLQSGLHDQKDPGGRVTSRDLGAEEKGSCRSCSTALVGDLQLQENRELLRHVEGWKDLGGPKALEAPSPASPPASPPALPPKTPQTPKTSASPAGPAFSPPKTAEKRQKRKAKEEDPAAKKLESQFERSFEPRTLLSRRSRTAMMKEEHIQMPFDLNENEEIPMGVSSPFEVADLGIRFWSVRAKIQSEKTEWSETSSTCLEVWGSRTRRLVLKGPLKDGPTACLAYTDDQRGTVEHLGGTKKAIETLAGGPERARRPLTELLQGLGYTVDRIFSHRAMLGSLRTVDTNGFIAHNDQALRSDGQVTSNRAPKHQRDRNGISVDF